MSACVSRERVEEFIVDLTTPEERRAVERHLAECAECRAAYQRTRWVEESLAAAAAVPEAVVESGMARLQSALAVRPSESKTRRGVMPLIAAASLVAGTFAWILAPHPQEQARPAQEGPSFDEKRLATLPENAVDFRVSPDGRSVAHVVSDGQAFRLVEGAWTSPAFDSVESFGYTRAGVLVYAATKGGAQTLGFGKQVLTPAPRTHVISADGARLAWTVERSGAWFVASGGREDGPYDEVSDIVFTADGKRVAFAGRSGAKWSAVTDGLPGRPYDRVDSLIWSATGELAYRAFTKKKCAVVIGTRPSDEFDEVGPPVFHPNGRQAAFRARIGRGWFVVEGDKRGDEYDSVGTPYYTLDGRLVASLDGTLTVDGRELKQHDLPVKVSDLHVCLSTAGGTLAILEPTSVRVLGAGRVEFEGSGSYDSISGVRFITAPGGREVLVFRGVKNGWSHVVVDMEDGPRFRETGEPVFSGDGRRLAYPGLRSGKWALVIGTMRQDPKGGWISVESTRGEDFDAVGAPVFSADGKKIAFAARKGREVFWKVTTIE
jgi:hypothetical protein